MFRNAIPEWRKILEMTAVAAYAAEWEIRSYGGHTISQMVIRIETDSPI